MYLELFHGSVEGVANGDFIDTILTDSMPC